MFAARIDTDESALHGWLQDGTIDLFVWFDGSELVQAQITSGADAAEWKPPARLRTGVVRESPLEKSRIGPEAPVIELDRRPVVTRIDAIRGAVSNSSLPAAAASLIAGLLESELHVESASAVRKIVLDAPKAAQK